MIINIIKTTKNNNATAPEDIKIIFCCLSILVVFLVNSFLTAIFVESANFNLADNVSICFLKLILSFLCNSDKIEMKEESIFCF